MILECAESGMDQQLISIIEIAQTHGKRRQSIHKLVKRLGIEVVKRKSDNARGQAISYVTTSAYEEELKIQLEKPDNLIASTSTDGSGFFYVVQLEPLADPGRFKAGFTTDPGQRIRSHRTSAPFAKLIKVWPCKLLWEKTAIDCITQDCERLYTEVFRTESIDHVISRSDRFFELMPDTLAMNSQDGEVC